MLFARLCVRVGNLLTCGKYLYDLHNFTKKGGLGEISLTPITVYEVRVSNQEYERSCICVFGGIKFTSFYNFTIGF